jgi:error-prone DNA polymerase
MISSFVHLDVRSCFSLKEGAFTPEQLASRAAELGMPAVAMTDRDGLYGAARFVDACTKAGVRPILGASLTVREWEVHERGTMGSRRTGHPLDPDPDHVVLLAEDASGYANLCRLITDAHLLGERGDPWVAPEQVLAHASGLVALLGPRSAPGRLAVAGRVDTGAKVLGPFREAFGDRLYVAVEHRMERRSGEEIRAMLRLAEHAEVEPVATNPVRYLVPGDAFLADALECMREIVPVASNHVSRENAEGWLKPAEALRLLFAERPDLVDRSLEVADRCRYDLDLGSRHVPDFPTPVGRSADMVLAERCWRGVHERGLAETPELRDRLHHELSMIRRMGFGAFFLTVSEIVDDIRAMGVACACRGSAAGSLVCHLVGISDVDALRHDLAFERFMNPMRDELPDIDIDVESARREDIYDMILSRHGDERAACVAMVDTYRARSALREVGKALGLPDGDVGEIAKRFPHISARHLREAVERLPELRGANLKLEQLELLYRVAERLDGFPRHIALHPCGIVLASHDLVERVPLERSANGHRTIQADKDDVELLGYLKLDILGVRMLSAMRHCLDEIARTTGEKVDLGRISLDDRPTFELMRRSDTLGCFQIESPGQRELLQKLQPEVFEDLIVEISLFRPGPVKSDMITPYLRRRAGMNRPTYVHPDLRPALRETFGVIVYHEQVIRTLAAIAGYDLTYADHVRRHLDREDLVPGFRAEFLELAIARGVDPDAAERTWEAVAQFASFGFCKAHAAAFAVPTYRSAWLKTHYAAHFLAGILTHDPGMYPRRLLLDDARRHRIPILPLDANRSEREYVVEEVDGLLGGSPGWGREDVRAARLRSTTPSRPPAPNRRLGTESPDLDHIPVTFGIRLALQDVRGISDAEIRSILIARADRPFCDVGDLLRRTSVSRPVAEALAHAGAFDAVGEMNRRAHLYDAITTEAPREGDQLTLSYTPPGRGRSVRKELQHRDPDGGGGAATDGSGIGEAPGAAPPQRSMRTGPGATESKQAGSHAEFSFAAYSDAEVVRAELDVLGLDATRHLVSFYEPLLRDLGVTRAADLGRARGGIRVMVAGVKVASQTPAIRSGQRIIFLTLDDATGPVEVTVFESVQPKVARTVFHAYAMAVCGELRRTGVRGVSIIAEDVWDLTALHTAWRNGELREAMSRDNSRAPTWRDNSRAPTWRADPRAPTRKLWHASGGSAG